MNPLERREIGKTGVFVSSLGLGGGGIGGLYTSVSETQAVSTVLKALDLGVSYIDTAPLYGLGKSETAVGKAIEQRKRMSFVISTKVGILISGNSTVYDFTEEGVMKSFQRSLQRLGLESVDIVFIHDPVNYYTDVVSKAYSCLRDLKSRGLCRAIGVGMNEWEMEQRFAMERDFDCFLLAGRYTLLDQSSLRSFLPLCQKKGIGVIMGGPFNSGILASDLSGDAKYDYASASEDILLRARQINDVCAGYGVPLKAAALQFVLAHPAVTSVLTGARSPEEITENFEMIQYPIPDKMWIALLERDLIDPRSYVPN